MNRIAWIALIMLCLFGCAYTQSVNLLPPNHDSVNLSNNIVITDLRGDEEKSTRIDSERTARLYGDKFIEPNKIDFLKHAFSGVSGKNEEVFIEITRFDTIELFPGDLEDIQKGGPLAAFGAIGALVHLATLEDTPHPGDNLVIVLEGRINGNSFKVDDLFNYSDLKYVNFPCSNPVYRERLKKMLLKAVNSIYTDK